MRVKMDTLVKEYDSKHAAKRDDLAQFKASESIEIIDMTDNNGLPFLFQVMLNSMKAGYSMGYRAAKADARKRLA